MDESISKKRTVVTQESRVAFPPHIKLHRDAVRQQWLILAPERVFHPDEISVAVLKQCDGTRTVAEIAEKLTHEYQATIDVIQPDILDMLQDLADKGLVDA